MAYFAHLVAVQFEVDHQFGVVVEVIFYGVFGAARNEEGLPDAGIYELFYHVLDDGIAPHG